MTRQQMPHQSGYKTLPCGAIDYAHYTAKGRTERSLAAHAMLRAIASGIVRMMRRTTTKHGECPVALHPAE